MRKTTRHNKNRNGKKKGPEPKPQLGALRPEELWNICEAMITNKYYLLTESEIIQSHLRPRLWGIDRVIVSNRERTVRVVLYEVATIEITVLGF